jgi:hypothetical protein
MTFIHSATTRRPSRYGPARTPPCWTQPSPTTCCATGMPGHRDQRYAESSSTFALNWSSHNADPHAAPAHPLAMVPTLDRAVAQYHRTQPTIDHASLTTPPKGQTRSTTGKAGQTSSYPVLIARESGSTHPDTNYSASRWIQTTMLDVHFDPGALGCPGETGCDLGIRVRSTSIVGCAGFTEPRRQTIGGLLVVSMSPSGMPLPGLRPLRCWQRKNRNRRKPR